MLNDSSTCAASNHMTNGERIHKHHMARYKKNQQHCIDKNQSIINRKLVYRYF